MTVRAGSHSEDAARPNETDGDSRTDHVGAGARATRHTRRRYNLTAPVYDLFEAPMERTLYAAWRRTLWREVRGSEVLEIGVGTGKNIPNYPPGIHVTAVDLSSRMLQRAHRVAHEHSNKRVALLEMNAQAAVGGDFSNGRLKLGFADGGDLRFPARLTSERRPCDGPSCHSGGSTANPSRYLRDGEMWCGGTDQT